MHKFYFLYFAESGRLVGMYSELRKAFGRQPDPLFEITHDVMGDMRLSWQKIEDNLGVPVEHFFRDDVPETLRDFLHKKEIDLPAVVGLNAEGQNQVVFTTDDLAKFGGKAHVLGEKLSEFLKLKI